MGKTLAIILTAIFFAPCVAHAGSDQTVNGDIGADGAVTGPVGDLEQVDRSVSGAIGSDGAVVGPVGGLQVNDRSGAGAIGESGAVLGPVGGPASRNRALSGPIGSNGAVIGPVGGRSQLDRPLGGAIGENGAVTGPVGGFAGPNASQQGGPAFSISGPVVPGQRLPESSNSLFPGGGVGAVIVNGHRVLLVPGSNQIMQVLD